MGKTKWWEKRGKGRKGVKERRQRGRSLGDFYPEDSSYRWVMRCLYSDPRPCVCVFIPPLTLFLYFLKTYNIQTFKTRFGDQTPLRFTHIMNNRLV